MLPCEVTNARAHVDLTCEGAGGCQTETPLFRRPAISLGAGPAHQHCPVSVAQAISPKEGLDGLLVVDDCERAGPVRAPQAAIETPGIEHAGKRVPNILEGIRFGRLASSSTFGRSAQGCGGAGGTR